MPPSRSNTGARLEPPRKSVELEDPGATGLESSEGEEEYFSDASEGRRKISRPATPSSPIPTTRVEKVDEAPSHGEVPGTPAYDKRRQDAVPDEVEVLPEGQLSQRNSRQFLDRPTTPGGTSTPKTVVEKIDPSSPSHGEVPGTHAYRQRQADATPDVILKTPDPVKGPHYREETKHGRTKSDLPIPETIVTRVDDTPAHGEVEGTVAREVRQEDASPDVLRYGGDVAGSPTLDRSIRPDNTARRRSMLPLSKADLDINDGDDFGDDFDDFEEGAQTGADDDFGDFDDGFQDLGHEAETENNLSHRQTLPASSVSFPLLDLEAATSLSDLLTATQVHLDVMFPSTMSENTSTFPEAEAIPADSPIFASERSRSLWKQLITPPPLQAPNWTQSRIRRLFLISLGVPVDLDEILPPSKQKKLILPDINLEPSPTSHRADSDSSKPLGSVSRLKAEAANDSSNSIDSTQSQPQPGRPSSGKSRRPRGPPPPPELDLPAVKRLCATTDEKLDGFTDEELQSHNKELEILTEKTSEVLEYWLKRRDGVRKEKEAFEGVIENLVRHARRVRK